MDAAVSIALAWIQRRKNPSVVYTFVECGVPKRYKAPKGAKFNKVIQHRAE